MITFLWDMNTGTQAAKEAGNMVDLDSSPTKLIDITRIGKQLLMTRGSLTTFSIANDVAKYFAIIPALFIGIYPGLASLNIMGLHSPQSAVLSAIIYNALIIIALIPLALKGVKYREVPAGKLLSHNLLVYGLGGLMGIGLALCKSIINAHGGNISVSDALPAGAVFTFTLPLEEVTIHDVCKFFLIYTIWIIYVAI